MNLRDQFTAALGLAAASRLVDELAAEIERQARVALTQDTDEEENEALAERLADTADLMRRSAASMQTTATFCEWRLGVHFNAKDDETSEVCS